MNIFPDRTTVSRIAVLIVAVTFSAASGRAVEQGGSEALEEAQPVTEHSDLNALLRFALFNNAGLKAAFQQWHAALQKIPQSEALPDPRLSYGYFVRSVETRVGPQNHRIGITQTIPWFGTLKLRGEQAGREAEIALRQLEARREQIRFEVRNAYNEYAYLHRAIEIVDENIGLLKQLEGVAQAKFKGGGTYLGVLKAQVEMGKLDDRGASLRDLLEPIQARLNAALSREANAVLPTPRIVPAPSPEDDDAGLVARLAGANPDLLGLSAGIVREENGVALARKSFFPDVTLGVDYIQTGNALSPATPGNGKDPVVAMFSINIPLWWKKLRAGVQEAEARREAAVERRADLGSRLAAGLKMALYGYRDAERKITLYRDSLVPSAKSALGVAQKAFEAGTADFLEIVDSQRLLLEFQLQVERSIADREQRLAEIDMLIARE